MITLSVDATHSFKLEFFLHRSEIVYKLLPHGKTISFFLYLRQMFQLSYITACIAGAIGAAGLLIVASKFFSYLRNRNRAGEHYYLMTIQHNEMKYTAQTLATSEEDARRKIVEAEQVSSDEISKVIRIDNFEQPDKFDEFLQA